MPKILIVDDEAIFRKGLRAMISAWDNQWDIVGDAVDGYHALELLTELQPDVILTDIRMPRMDGIQLQKIIRERFPHLICIVASGYEDFSYIQQSMRHGAKDYLMKPVEREELGLILNRIKEHLKTSSTKVEINSQPQEDSHLRKQASDHFVAGLMRKSLHEQDLEVLAKLGIQFTDPYYTCLVIKLDKDSVDRERYQQTDPSLFQLYIQQFVQEIIDHRTVGFSFIFSDTEVVALVNLRDEEGAHSRLLEVAESIRRQIKSLSNLTVTIGVGSPVDEFSAVPKTFKEAEIALLYRLVVGGDLVLDYETMTKDNQFQSEMKKWSWEVLEQTINEGRTSKIDKQVELVITELCKLAKTPEMVHQQICKLLIHYYEMTEELELTHTWLGQKDIRTILIKICSISSSEELIEECTLLLGGLTASIAAGNKTTVQDPITQALLFMERHYDESITLKDMADKVYLNAAYFSTLFKQKTGKAFIERLTEIRVEQAKKRLASTEDKITTISDMTGFSNIRHFNRVFKNETGFTPKDYRSAVRSRS